MDEKAKRELRERMGLCVECGGLKTYPHHRMCDKCKAKEKAKRLTKLMEPTEVEAKLRSLEVKPDHKCWSCEWGRFEGDRFFCPLVLGTCVKDGTAFQKNGGKT